MSELRQPWSNYCSVVVCQIDKYAFRQVGKAYLSKTCLYVGLNFLIQYLILGPKLLTWAQRYGSREACEAKWAVPLLIVGLHWRIQMKVHRADKLRMSVNILTTLARLFIAHEIDSMCSLMCAAASAANTAGHLGFPVLQCRSKGYSQLQ